MQGKNADMMKLVDISDLGSDELVRGGSSPSIRIMKEKFFCKTFSLFENVSQNFVNSWVCSLVGRALSF